MRYWHDCSESEIAGGTALDGQRSQIPASSGAGWNWLDCGRKKARIQNLKGDPMNYLPFEDWLLEDQHLTSDQEHELQSHLRVCASCAAIAELNLALHSTLTNFTGRRFCIPF